MPNPKQERNYKSVQTVGRRSGAVITSAPTPAQPGTAAKVGSAVKYIAKDAVRAALLPPAVGVKAAMSAAPAAKNLASQPVQAIKSGLANVAKSHAQQAKGALTPVRTAKTLGPATSMVKAAMSATGNNVLPQFIRGAANTPPKR